MASEAFNSITGYTVGIPPVPVISASGNLVMNVQYPSGNVVVNSVTSNNYLYANGQPIYAPAGANTQVQFNDAGAFAGNIAFTFDKTTGTVAMSAMQIGVGANTFSRQFVQFSSTTSTAPNQVLWEILGSTVSEVDFNIIATDTTNSARQTVMIPSIIFGTTVEYTEYAGLGINGGVGIFAVGYSGGNLQLTVSPYAASLTEYHIAITTYSAF